MRGEFQQHGFFHSPSPSPSREREFEEILDFMLYQQNKLGNIEYSLLHTPNSLYVKQR